MATVLTTQGAEGLPRRAFTADEVRRMLDAGVLDWGEKFELIRGEIVPMASEKARHAQMKAQLARWLGRLLDDTWRVGCDITVSLGPIGIFEPDVLVWRPVSGDEFIPISAAVLAIEVADTTLRSDVRLKAPDYAAAGLPELWVVDLNGRETIRFTEPANGEWSRQERFAFDAPIASALAPTSAIRLASLT
jgi:Uma2 family endonuclease